MPRNMDDYWVLHDSVPYDQPHPTLEEPETVSRLRRLGQKTVALVKAVVTGEGQGTCSHAS